MKRKNFYKNVEYPQPEIIVDPNFEEARRQQLIVDQAKENGGFIPLIGHDKDYNDIVTDIWVAKVPFFRWCLGRTKLRMQYMFPWNNICHYSMKLQNDCQNHSDWWFGAGLTYDEYFDDPKKINNTAYHSATIVQREFANIKTLVLCNGGKVKGRIKHIKDLEDYNRMAQYKIDNPNVSSNNPTEVCDGDIIVIPHAGADFELAFLTATQSGAGGVITQVANKVAHLCKIARERDVTIMCEPNAFELYSDGFCTVTLDPDKGLIKAERF